MIMPVRGPITATAGWLLWDGDPAGEFAGVSPPGTTYPVGSGTTRDPARTAGTVLPTLTVHSAAVVGGGVGTPVATKRAASSAVVRRLRQKVRQKRWSLRELAWRSKRVRMRALRTRNELSLPPCGDSLHCNESQFINGAYVKC